MANMSDYLESGIRDHLFRAKTFSKPSVLAICLSSGTPVDSFTGANMREWQNAGGYVRQTLNPSDTNWSADDNTNGYAYNMVAITFPVVTAGGGGWVSGIVVTDSATYGASNALVWATPTTPKFYDVNDQVVIPVSGLSFQCL